MPKRLSLRAHLAVNALETHDRRAQDPMVRRHWQAIWLLAREQTSAHVAAVTGYSVTWMRTLGRRYHQQGPAGLEDRRHRHPGATGLLSMAQRAALAAARQRPPPDGGVWTGPKAAAWMTAALGRRVHAQRGWEALRRLGWTSKVPRPRHAKAAPTAPAAFKKNLPAVVHTLQQAYPQQEVELWATDQHRLGLKPILRRVWSPRGPRPGAVVQHR